MSTNQGPTKMTRKSCTTFGKNVHQLSVWSGTKVNFHILPVDFMVEISGTTRKTTTGRADGNTEIVL
ncbi:uncharacterized protein ACN427_005246 isoform 2-T2 [Glossina fuscipes fuscipes]